MSKKKTKQGSKRVGQLQAALVKGGLDMDDVNTFVLLLLLLKLS